MRNYARRLGIAVPASAVLLLFACDVSEEAPTSHAVSQVVNEAVAELEPTQGNHVRGSARFVDDGEGVRMIAEVRGLPAGPHGFHVHEIGDCSAPDASSAGPHFAFGPTEDPPRRITGNLGELRPDEDGIARREARFERAELDGLRSIVRRSVVIHAQGNDPGQPPSGGAGKRIACGVIEAIRP